MNSNKAWNPIQRDSFKNGFFDVELEWCVKLEQPRIPTKYGTRIGVIVNKMFSLAWNSNKAWTWTTRGTRVFFLKWILMRGTPIRFEHEQRCFFSIESYEVWTRTRLGTFWLFSTFLNSFGFFSGWLADNKSVAPRCPEKGHGEQAQVKTRSEHRGRVSQGSG